MSNIVVRPERPADRAAIFQVNSLAFDREDEGKLVDAIRSGTASRLSLVAGQGGMIVGHIFFSPVTITGAAGGVDACGLGPMAVLPDHQRQGIGTALIRAGLDAARAAGHDAVVVLGHPGYYSRFGFVPAHTKNLACEFEAPPEEFMVLELRAGALDPVTREDRGNGGIVKYLPEFSEI